VTLAGKVALVTGSGRGIGRGCALELARAGADVIVNDRPGSPDIDATATDVRALGRRCAAIETDVFTRAGCETLVQEAVTSLGPIDILVSNPACTVRLDFLDYPPETFERVIQGTLISGFHMAQLAARQMVAREGDRGAGGVMGRGGKIIFISSVHAEMPFARSVAYNAAKAGLNHLARTIAVELFPRRINVNVIEPGWIDTPGERALFPEAVIQERGPHLPWGRLGTPADIGRAAAFLASDEADYITGAVLAVDGGFRWKDCGA
jgi:glucose 1-dehydrogenase